MTVRLLNSACMPVPGTYRLSALKPARFANLVRYYTESCELISYVGYPDACRILEEFCEVPIALNRQSTPVEDGDLLLIARLKYRVGNPAAKGQVRATIDDYEFFKCSYSAASETPSVL
jgi:hypothetical protein